LAVFILKGRGSMTNTFPTLGKVFSRGHSTCSVCFLANHFEHRTSDVSGMELQKQKIATPKLWPVLGDCSLII
ncbi:MAG: hypothetical protein ACTJFH_12325, partial [Lactiplantibacillus plantarum]